MIEGAQNLPCRIFFFLLMGCAPCKFTKYKVVKVLPSEYSFFSPLVLMGCAHLLKAGS